MGDGLETGDVFPAIQHLPTCALLHEQYAAVALLAKFKNQPPLRDHFKHLADYCAANVRSFLSTSWHHP